MREARSGSEEEACTRSSKTEDDADNRVTEQLRRYQLTDRAQLRFPSCDAVHERESEHAFSETTGTVRAVLASGSRVTQLCFAGRAG